jgi:hypothetical protein
MYVIQELFLSRATAYSKRVPDWHTLVEVEKLPSAEHVARRLSASESKALRVCLLHNNELTVTTVYRDGIRIPECDWNDEDTA